MKRTALLLSLIVPCFIGAQEDTTTKEREKKFIRIVSISGYGGAELYSDGYEDRTMFQQAVPGSTLAYTDISGYTNYNGGFVYTRSGVTAGLNVNIHLRCQKRFGELRGGIGHSNVSVISLSYGMRSTTSIDTTALP